MPMTELLLVALMALATLASVGMFAPTEPFLEIVLPFIAAFLWGIVALSSVSITITHGNGTETIEALPLVYLAGAFAMLASLVGIYALIKRPAAEVSEQYDGGLP